MGEKQDRYKEVRREAQSRSAVESFRDLHTREGVWT